MGISENVGRADMTLMEEAQAYADLVGFGYTAERIAEMLTSLKTAWHREQPCTVSTLRR